MPSFFASGSDRFTCSGSVIDGRGIFTAATISRVTLAGATTAGVRIVQGTSTALPSLALRSSATLPMRGSIEGSAAAAGANCIASMASAYELLQSISLLMAYSGGQGILTIAASRSYVGQPWASTAVRLNLAYYVNTPDDAARRILHGVAQLKAEAVPVAEKLFEVHDIAKVLVITVESVGAANGLKQVVVTQLVIQVDVRATGRVETG